MLYKLHFWFASAGENALTILIGVYMQTYTDGSSTEIGALLMMMPFLGLFTRPIICSIADRHQAHQKCLIYCLLFVTLSYFPFIVVPLSGPQLYEQHPRLCWWSLVTLKVMGDIAFGGVLTMGDSLAVNYAKRIGADYGTYRVWGTISFMFFGIVTGHVNEVPFLPKYVPAFMILCSTSALDAVVCWLWPAEFFRMVAAADQADKSSGDTLEPSKEPKAIKKLMFDEDVRAHMKQKLLSLIPFKSSTAKVKSVELEAVTVEAVANAEVKSSTAATEEHNVDTKTQLLILAMLFRRDPRMILYMSAFVCTGASLVGTSFFYMSLSDICNQQGSCHFSRLAGYLQVSMAIAAVATYSFAGQVLSFTGRVNLCSATLALAAFKYLFYGTIWTSLDPHWALLIEPIHGICFSCSMVLMVELGHKFANQVDCIIAQLVERKIIYNSANFDKVRLSLPATMLSVLSAAMDGIGRGFGALIYGILLAHYSYESLWLMIGIFVGLASLTSVAFSLIDYVFDLQLGLDAQAKRCNSADCSR